MKSFTVTVKYRFNGDSRATSYPFTIDALNAQDAIIRALSQDEWDFADGIISVTVSAL